MDDVPFRLMAISVCALIAGSAMVRIYRALKTNGDSLRRW